MQSWQHYQYWSGAELWRSAEIVDKALMKVCTFPPFQQHQLWLSSTPLTFDESLYFPTISAASVMTILYTTHLWWKFVLSHHFSSISYDYPLHHSPLMKVCTFPPFQHQLWLSSTPLTFDESLYFPTISAASVMTILYTTHLWWKFVLSHHFSSISYNYPLHHSPLMKVCSFPPFQQHQLWLSSTPLTFDESLYFPTISAASVMTILYTTHLWWKFVLSHHFSSISYDYPLHHSPLMKVCTFPPFQQHQLWLSSTPLTFNESLYFPTISAASVMTILYTTHLWCHHGRRSVDGIIRHAVRFYIESKVCWNGDMWFFHTFLKLFETSYSLPQTLWQYFISPLCVNNYLDLWNI